MQRKEVNLYPGKTANIAGHVSIPFSGCPALYFIDTIFVDLRKQNSKIKAQMLLNFFNLC